MNKQSPEVQQEIKRLARRVEFLQEEIVKFDRTLGHYLGQYLVIWLEDSHEFYQEVRDTIVLRIQQEIKRIELEKELLSNT